MSISERYTHVATLRQVDDILSAAATGRRRDELEIETPYTPPSTDEERQLADVWSEVLELDRVGIDDNFFELPGDSLRMTQALARIAQRFGVDVPIEVFFEGPTIRQLAAALRRSPPRETTALDIEALLAQAETHDAD